MSLPIVGAIGCTDAWSCADQDNGNDPLHSCRGLVWIAIFGLLTLVGCAASKTQIAEHDKTLARLTEDGREAFTEGDVTAAVATYRRALLRAWAIDDPYESGTVAYHLAACLASEQRFAEARDWLVDARVELCRAKTSTGNAWLLAADIAMAENRFDLANEAIANADRVCPPCLVDSSFCLCGPGDSCRELECKDCRLLRIPMLCKKVERNKECKDCAQAYQARVLLTRARLAAKQYEVEVANQLWECACDLAEGLCNLSLRADLHDVAALIDDARGHFLYAGAHRDREVKILRCIAHYREIPNVLDAAAASYQTAERLDLAIDRLIRSARIRLARGEAQQAWDRIRAASELAECSCGESVKIRLALTATMIRDQLKDGTTVNELSDDLDPSNGHKEFDELLEETPLESLQVPLEPPR